MTTIHALTMALIAEIASIDDVEHLKSLVNDYFRQLKLDYYMFSLYQAESLVQPDIFMLDNYPAGWCDLYYQNNYYLTDPITAYCFEHVVPIFWEDLLSMPEFQAPCFQAMMQRAKQFGMHSGLSIPLSTTFGFKGIFNLVSQQNGGQSKVLLEQLCPHILHLSTHLMQWFKQYHQLNTLKEKPQQALTSREYECLFWACEGKSSWDIAQILGITERTVIFHLNHVMTKLGVNNRQHAVAKGLLTHLVRPKFQ